MVEGRIKDAVNQCLEFGPVAVFVQTAIAGRAKAAQKTSYGKSVKLLAPRHHHSTPLPEKKKKKKKEKKEKPALASHFRAYEV